MLSKKSSKDKRQYPRIEAKVKVVFRSVQALVSEYTRNISGGGIFLKTDRLLDPNADVDLQMIFPGGLGEFSVKGRVARLMSMTDPSDPSRQLHGVGIRFIDPDPRMLDIIEQAVRGTLSIT